MPFYPYSVKPQSYAFKHATYIRQSFPPLLIGQISLESVLSIKYSSQINHCH